MSGALEFDIGMTASCEDGSCGVLSRVVIDPIKRSVTHLVVEPHHQHSLARLVPVDLAEVHDGELKLRCTIAQWRALQFVQETEYVLPGGPWLEYPSDSILGLPNYESTPPMIVRERLPPGEVEVRRGQHIHATDGVIGRVEGVVVDPADDHLTHILLQQGHLWGKKQVAIPVSALERIENDGLCVSLAKHEIAELPAINAAYPSL